MKNAQPISLADLQTRLAASDNAGFKEQVARCVSLADHDWVCVGDTHHKRGTSLVHPALFVDGDLQVDGKLLTRKRGVADNSWLLVMGDLTVDSLLQAAGAMVLVAGTLTIRGKGDFRRPDSVFYQCGPLRAQEVVGGGGGSWLSVFHPDVKIGLLRGYAENRTGAQLTDAVTERRPL